VDPASGPPSDDLPAVLAIGRAPVTTIFVSMAARHPDGRDAEYLAWHALDHRPEQHRLASLRGSLRLISTAACRAARAVSDDRYDAVDHVMTYLFAEPAGLEPFRALGAALAEAGRMPLRLPSIEHGVYAVEGAAAAPRVLAGADVIPWRPATGIYLVLERITEADVERGAASGHALVDVPGVAGAWWHSSVSPPDADADAGEHLRLQITYCYLDDDPCATAERLEPVVRERWERSGLVPLLAAPFHSVVPGDWDRHLP
jgi:hypothetical protein